MINKHTILLVALMAFLAPVCSFAAELGDPAPPLTVKKWIKGNPVNVKAGTNIYVLVFCTLSRANDFALTNLSILQKIYRDKGVVVVAISDESPEPLKEFVHSKGRKLNSLPPPTTTGAEPRSTTSGPSNKLPFPGRMSWARTARCFGTAIH